MIYGRQILNFLSSHYEQKPIQSVEHADVFVLITLAMRIDKSGNKSWSIKFIIQYTMFNIPVYMKIHEAESSEWWLIYSIKRTGTTYKAFMWNTIKNKYRPYCPYWTCIKNMSVYTCRSIYRPYISNTVIGLAWNRTENTMRCAHSVQLSTKQFSSLTSDLNKSADC